MEFSTAMMGVPGWTALESLLHGPEPSPRLAAVQAYFFANLRAAGQSGRTD